MKNMSWSADNIPIWFVYVDFTSYYISTMGYQELSDIPQIKQMSDSNQEFISGNSTKWNQLP